jgi:hypothetical protein
MRQGIGNVIPVITCSYDLQVVNKSNYVKGKKVKLSL